MATKRPLILPRPMILQAADTPDFSGMLEDHQDRHAAYCKQHGYEYQALPMHEGDWVGFWEKLVLIQESVKSGKYSHVIWLDADTIIADFSVGLADALPAWASLGMTAHPYPSMFREPIHFNAGAMYWRCDEWAIAFLEHVFALRNARPSAPAGIGYAVAQLDGRHVTCERDPSYIDQWAVNETLSCTPEWQERFVVLPRRWNNSVHDQDCSAPVIAAFHGNGVPIGRRIRMQRWAAEHPHPAE